MYQETQSSFSFIKATVSQLLSESHPAKTAQSFHWRASFPPTHFFPLSLPSPDSVSISSETSLLQEIKSYFRIRIFQKKYWNMSSICVEMGWLGKLGVIIFTLSHIRMWPVGLTPGIIPTSSNPNLFLTISSRFHFQQALGLLNNVAKLLSYQGEPLSKHALKEENPRPLQFTPINILEKAQVIKSQSSVEAVRQCSHLSKGLTCQKLRGIFLFNLNSSFSFGYTENQE